MRFFSGIALVPALFGTVWASPFQLEVQTVRADKDGVEFRVSVAIPELTLVYADSFKVESQPLPICIEPAAAAHIPDPFDGGTMITAYTQPFATVWRLPSVRQGQQMTVAFQGCDASICYLPEQHHFFYDLARRAFTRVQPLPDDAVHTDWLDGRAHFTAGGYLSATDLLAFLDKAEGKPVAVRSVLATFLDNPVTFFHAHGIWLTLLLVLLGGLLLNLTPCVLPMIPINLAIIGAGSGRRGQGFARGAAYGAGMVGVYGGTGWVVLKSGVFFGALQSSPWFNLAIAVLFLALALAMLDVFVIDFTRLASATGESRKQGLWAALAAGGVAALLAGACVAPVVLAVLLLAGTLTASGEPLAQFLPFVLGLGMALPWPFAGAGLSVLPRPGAWMKRVKQLFGTLIILMACYYAYLAFTAFHPVPSSHHHDTLQAGDYAAWQERLAHARNEGKPIFVDFWATWCKNCMAMERTTFRDPQVTERLNSYVVIRVQAEHPNHPATQDMLNAFDIRGLPGIVVLQ